MMRYFEHFATPGVTKVLKSTVRLCKINCSPYKFKKNHPVEKMGYLLSGAKIPDLFISA
jgi:hypothetical protein